MAMISTKAGEKEGESEGALEGARKTLDKGLKASLIGRSVKTGGHREKSLPQRLENGMGDTLGVANRRSHRPTPGGQYGRPTRHNADRLDRSAQAPPRKYNYEGQLVELFLCEDGEYRVSVKNGAIVWDKPMRRPRMAEQNDMSWQLNRGNKGPMRGARFQGMTRTQIRRAQREYALKRKQRSQEQQLAPGRQGRSSEEKFKDVQEDDHRRTIRTDGRRVNRNPRPARNAR